MPFRKSKATKAKEAVTEQVTDRTDDLMAALEAAKEALARASAAAGRMGAGLGKQATEAADKLMPERARQRRREAARRRNRRLLAGAAGLGLAVALASRLTGSKADRTGGWERAPEPGRDGDPVAAEVTPLHGNGAGGDPARTPPS
jgi:ferric-dicitrate binding protein FerR (iron transport regulator)